METVGNVEGVTNLVVDFSNTMLTITLDTTLTTPTWNAVPFNGPVFTATTPLSISSATVDPATTMVGFDNGRVSFTSNEIEINWEGLSYVNGTIVKIDFASVPEPSSLAILAVAFPGLLITRRWTASRRV